MLNNTCNYTVRCMIKYNLLDCDETLVIWNLSGFSLCQVYIVTITINVKCFLLCCWLVFMIDIDEVFLSQYCNFDNNNRQTLNLIKPVFCP